MHARAEISVAVALDTTDLALACRWAALVDPHVQLVKLGLEFYLRNGQAGVVQVRESAPSTGLFLDLKLHDIPATVAGAARAIASLQPDYLTVHAAGGAAMVEAAATQLPDTRIAAVTVLTSLSSSDIAALGLAPAAELVSLWADSAVNAGARAIVASAQEVADLRSRQSDAIHLITPGIRPAGAAANDQIRVATPTKAILDGADVLVIGRPITQSDDPAGAAAAVIAEVAAARAPGLRVTPVPPLADGDKARGRDAALAARRIRATIKRDLKLGRMAGGDVVWLASVDSAEGRAAARMTIGDLLLSLPGVGPARATTALTTADVSGQRRVSALGPHQLEKLRELLQ